MAAIKPPYTHEKLTSASREDVIEAINNHLGKFQANDPENAQLLLQELTRRTQNRQAWFMIILTIAIVFLAFVQIWASLRAH